DVVGGGEEEGGVGAGGPAVVGVVVGEDGVARGQRFDQRRVRATDGVAVQVGGGVEAQAGHRLGFVDRAEEVDLVAGGGHDPGVVLVICRVVAAQTGPLHTPR